MVALAVLSQCTCVTNDRRRHADLCQKVILSRIAKIGRVASEEVTLQLIKVNVNQYYYIYGLEAFPLTKSDLQSLDFVINRFFMKLFTNIIAIVKYCQEYFGFALPSVLWAKRVSKFESSFKCFCLLCNCVVLIVFVLFTLLPCLFGE